MGSSHQWSLLRSHSEPSVSQNLSVVLSSTVECIIGIETPEIFRILTLAPWPVMWELYGRKSHMEVTRAAFIQENKKKQYCIPGGIANIGANIKVWKNPGAIPTTSPFDLPIWPMQKTYCS